jgi:hypothetical protein
MEFASLALEFAERKWSLEYYDQLVDYADLTKSRWCNFDDAAKTTRAALNARQFALVYKAYVLRTDTTCFSTGELTYKCWDEIIEREADN